MENFLVTISALGAFALGDSHEGLMVLFLYDLGKVLESMAVNKSRNSVAELMDIKEETSNLKEKNKIIVVPTTEIKVGDIIVVKEGERVPLDGTIVKGSSMLDTSALTGESLPISVKVGDNILSGSINKGGLLEVKVTSIYKDSTVNKILELVETATERKTKTEKVVSKYSSKYTLGVIIIAILTAVLLPLFTSLTYSESIYKGLTILVISCPCAIAISIPLSYFSGIGASSREGILVKGSNYLDSIKNIKEIAFDKTGTITKGEPQVTDMIPAEGISEEELLGCAYALEKKSEHPLAKAIIARAEEKKTVLQEVSDFQALPGNGLRAVLNSDVLTGGNMKFISNETSVSSELISKAQKLAEEGKTPLLFAKGGKFLGMIAVADVIKEDSPQAIKELQNMGIRVVMLTGDNERTAKAIGAQAGVDDVIAGVLPDGKESVIRSLKEQGKVAMVGDGINDAPALTRADIGIAIGAGTDVAIDAADVVLMKSRLSDVPAAIRLSRATLRNIHENLFWAFFYNVIGIPLAAGVWIPIFGWTLNPMFGAAAMSLSSFCVVTNALRLNLFKVHDASRDKKIKQNVEEIHYISANAEMKNVTENKSLKAENPDFCNSEIHDPKDQENIKENKENKEMTTITVNVTGMMCGHCEAHVTKAVKEAFGVEDVVSSHEKGTTVIHAPEKLDEDKIREVIKEAGYEVTGITQE